MLNLFPEPKIPYFIYAPPWTHESSGVRALHLLCHALNESGQRAYLIPVNTWYFTNPALNTPVITDEQLAWYGLKGIEPIAVYPDIVQGNPFKLKKVVRWLLAPAGSYGGDQTFAEADKVYGYTKDIADPVLCLPTFDGSIFYPKNDVRKGACYYSHKYDKIHGNKLLPLTDGMIRCMGTSEEVAAILRSHEECYIYERSEIYVLARLCGCKPVPVLTNYWDGKMPEEFNQPQSVLHDNFEWQLKHFIEDTQRMNG